ncbi:uncharacterized protein [Neodiprion pinetum]|uniref:uncharacterized protein n=1 Tax=Neodiprion pinetum TaxID=441929 RepID=UPI001EDFAABB|nr:uncharacterized protein LOC124217598 [Neodiprion pinetum]
MAPSSRIVSLLITCSLTVFVTYPARGAEISSKIDLDEELTTPPSTLSTSVLKAYVDINQGGGLGPKPQRISSKQPPRGFRQPAGRPANNHEDDDDENEFVSIDDLFEGNRQQIHQNPLTGSPAANRQGFYGTESGVRPTIINNIHVTINANDSGPGVNGCKNGVCDVRVSSKPDAEGNVITNVHLSVVTKLNKTPVQVTDVPVIEGTAGLPSPDFDQLPAFHFVDQNVRHTGSFFDNNIPQIPIHRQDVDSWYHQPQPLFQRARPVWYYGRNLDRGFKESRGSWQGPRGWTETGNWGIIDDKIEPPLSKTKLSNERD